MQESLPQSCPGTLGEYGHQRPRSFRYHLCQGSRRVVHGQHDAEQTLQALADHGGLGAFLPADGGDGEEVLAEFAKAGVDTHALAARLQDEGAVSFVKFWNELIQVIATKSADLAKVAEANRRSRTLP